MASEDNNLASEAVKNQQSQEVIKNVTIKQEIDNDITPENDTSVVQIKIERETCDTYEDTSNENNDSVYNPFQNIQVEVKQEISPVCEKATDSTAILKRFNKGISESQEKENVGQIERQNDSIKNSDLAITKRENVGCNIKNEIMMEDESLVSYDYPDFNDTASVDSNEATALSNVETRLNENVKMKSENSGNYEEDGNVRNEFDKVDVKLENELTVTETHLISNKLINTTSTVTRPQDGVIESQTTKTLVMEILPMTHSGNVPLSKIGNPEEILPTCSEPMDYEESFQLNSITGNVLSLEQEAYGLLKAKRKTNCSERRFVCPKCPKAYKTSNSLTVHLGVHTSIERREQGIIKGQRTRIENQRKKQEEMMEQEYDTLEDLKRKEKIVDKEGYRCTCGKVFQRRSRMETCLRSHNLFSDSNACYSCITCAKKFKRKEELALHRKRLHSRKKFPCKFCPTNYNTQKELFKHLQVHQKVQLMEYKVISEIVKGKHKLRCFMCAKTYTELSELKSHVMEDHKEPYICPRCKGTFPKIIDFGNHTKTCHPEVEGQSVLDVLEAFSKLVQAWKCEECELQFHEADKLAMHQIEKHTPDLKVEPQFQCTDCHRVFISQKGLTSHRRVHHSTESTEESEAVEKGIMCLECRKMCKDMNSLTSHMRFHSPERKYPCKFCDFRFATPEKRKTHADIHTGDMKYVCFICEYQCSSENRLKQHKMSIKHLNMKEYLLTGKPLVEEEQSTSKQESIKDVSKKKEWSLKEKKKEKESDSDSSDSDISEVTCDICGDKFSSESKMLEHKETHPFIEFPNEDKPTRIFFK